MVLLSVTLKAIPEDWLGWTPALSVHRPFTSWMLLLRMWIPASVPLVSFSSWMPPRSAALDAGLVISRFWMVQNCWSFRRMVAAAPPPLRIGAAPLPYLEMTIGLPLEPEPCGWSAPVQEPPAWNWIWLPVLKVVESTLVSVFQGVPALHPSLLSLPDDDETKYVVHVAACAAVAGSTTSPSAAAALPVAAMRRLCHLRIAFLFERERICEVGRTGACGARNGARRKRAACTGRLWGLRRDGGAT